jgi:pyruvate/2-oxoglutarate dehydrogenase complex dihydrolipoamide dehydrogenase (E3) component
VEVHGKTLQFAAAVIATGATSAIPDIKGLKVRSASPPPCAVKAMTQVPRLVMLILPVTESKMKRFYRRCAPSSQ